MACLCAVRGAGRKRGRRWKCPRPLLACCGEFWVSSRRPPHVCGSPPRARPHSRCVHVTDQGFLCKGGRKKEGNGGRGVSPIGVCFYKDGRKKEGKGGVGLGCVVRGRVCLGRSARSLASPYFVSLCSLSFVLRRVNRCVLSSVRSLTRSLTLLFCFPLLCCPLFCSHACPLPP